MIRYLLVDEDGQLHEKTAPDYRVALVDCGPEGWDRQSLGFPITAFLNDCGLVMPDRYRRCVVAACMMVALGAPARAYAGPVVFTGWDPHTNDVEVCSLSNRSVELLRALHADVRRVVGLDEGDELTVITPDAREEIRGYAEWLPTAPYQGIEVLGGADALDALRGVR